MRSQNFARHSVPMTDDLDSDRIYRGEERVVLALALKASGLSARQAAAKMDISDTRLRHIVNGYQPVGRGQKVAVVAPSDTLARIAMVLNVSAEDLERAGRADAARELRARLRQLVSTGDDSQALVDAVREWAEDPVNFIAPDDALRFFDDTALLGEVQRRLERLREHARGEAPHGYWDSGHAESVVPIRDGVSAATDSVDDVIAADQDVDPDLMTGEVEESDTP